MKTSALVASAPASITLLATLLSVSASASNWELTELRTLGGTESFAYAINDSGQVVGESRTLGDSSTHAILFGRRQPTDLFPLNSEEVITVGPTGINNRGQIASGVIWRGIYLPAIYDSSRHRLRILGSLGGETSYGFNGVATAINNVGQAVGYSYIDDMDRHAFFFDNGAMEDLGSFGGYSAAMALNDSGVAVGFASDTVFGVAVAAMWDGEDITAICGSRESYAYGINNRGQVVGELLSDSLATRAFLYHKGIVTELGTLRTGRNSLAFKINNSGQIVGSADVISSVDTIRGPEPGQVYYQTNYEDHAFLYDNGRMVDLNAFVPANSGWELNYARDINERGEIVGYGTVDGYYRAFILIPAPGHARGRSPVSPQPPHPVAGPAGGRPR
jgi:probable HAF family extracellular repeat protein